MRTTNYMACSLILAVLFLAAANVNAGIVVSTNPQDVANLDKLFTVSITGSSSGLIANINGEIRAWDAINDNTAVIANIPFVNIPGEVGTATTYTMNFENYPINAFSIDNYPGGPLYDWSIDGVLIDNRDPSSNITYDIWQGAFTDPTTGDILSFIGYEGGALSFSVPTNMFGYDYDLDYAFNLTAYGPGTTANDPGVGVASPEPATLAVLGLGLAGLGAVTRRRRKK